MNIKTAIKIAARARTQRVRLGARRRNLTAEAIIALEENDRKRLTPRKRVAKNGT